jgi:hypothetical protein
VPPPFGASVRELLRACPDTAALRRTDLPLRPSAASDSA